MAITCGEIRSPSGHFIHPRIQDGHLDVASSQAPIATDEAAQANITAVAGTSHGKAGAAYFLDPDSMSTGDG